jgi:hypothetical protein
MYERLSATVDQPGCAMTKAPHQDDYRQPGDGSGKHDKVLLPCLHATGGQGAQLTSGPGHPDRGTEGGHGRDIAGVGRAADERQSRESRGSCTWRYARAKQVPQVDTGATDPIGHDAVRRSGCDLREGRRSQRQPTPAHGAQCESRRHEVERGKEQKDADGSDRQPRCLEERSPEGVVRVLRAGDCREGAGRGNGEEQRRAQEAARRNYPVPYPRHRRLVVHV